MNQIEAVQQHLINADGVPEVLSVGWQVFELVRAVTSASADRTADMYPAFTFSRGAAISGRNALALAPSLPPDCLARPDLSVPVTADVYEIADAIAELTSALGRRLREAADLAAAPDDKIACENAANDAKRVSRLLAKSA